MYDDVRDVVSSFKLRCDLNNKKYLATTVLLPFFEESECKGKIKFYNRFYYIWDLDYVINKTLGSHYILDVKICNDLLPPLGNYMMPYLRVDYMSSGDMNYYSMDSDFVNSYKSEYSNIQIKF